MIEPGLVGQLDRAAFVTLGFLLPPFTLLKSKIRESIFLRILYPKDETEPYGYVTMSVTHQL